MESAQAVVGTVLKPASACLTLPDSPSTNVKGTPSLASYPLTSTSEPASWRTQPAQLEGEESRIGLGWFLVSVDDDALYR